MQHFSRLRALNKKNPTCYRIPQCYIEFMKRRSQLKTYEEVEVALEKAVDALDIFDVEDVNDLSSMSVEEYAEWRRWEIID